MKKYHLIMEKFWLIAAILSFVYAVYMIGKFGLIESGIYLVMPFIAVALYYLRYYTRKRIEKEEEQNRNK
ncbi:MAG: hypothetical protein WEC59_10995 [Salibacteraceae bacterium]